MEIWLKQGKAALRLPILPAELEQELEMNNTVVNVNAVGEVNLLGKQKLRSLPLSAHFPNHKAYYDQYSKYPKPKDCVKKIETFEKNGVCRLIITGSAIDCNREITIEKATFKEQDGTGDIYYTIDTKSYTNVGGKRSNKGTKNKRYKVKKGDTWSKIAKKFYGNSKKATIAKIKKNSKMTKYKKPPVGKEVVIKK